MSGATGSLEESRENPAEGMDTAGPEAERLFPARPASLPARALDDPARPRAPVRGVP